MRYSICFTYVLYILLLLGAPIDADKSIVPRVILTLHAIPHFWATPWLHEIARDHDSSLVTSRFDVMINHLMEDPNRRFLCNEIPQFMAYYDLASVIRQQHIQQMVHTKQLTFANSIVQEQEEPEEQEAQEGGPESSTVFKMLLLNHNTIYNVFGTTIQHGWVSTPSAQEASFTAYHPLFHRLGYHSVIVYSTQKNCNVEDGASINSSNNNNIPPLFSVPQQFHWSPPSQPSHSMGMEDGGILTHIIQAVCNQSPTGEVDSQHPGHAETSPPQPVSLQSVSHSQMGTANSPKSNIDNLPVEGQPHILIPELLRLLQHSVIPTTASSHTTHVLVPWAVGQISTSQQSPSFQAMTSVINLINALPLYVENKPSNNDKIHHLLQGPHGKLLQRFLQHSAQCIQTDQQNNTPPDDARQCSCLSDDDFVTISSTTEASGSLCLDYKSGLVLRLASPHIYPIITPAPHDSQGPQEYPHRHHKEYQHQHKSHAYPTVEVVIKMRESSLDEYFTALRQQVVDAWVGHSIHTQRHGGPSPGQTTHQQEAEVPVSTPPRKKIPSAPTNSLAMATIGYIPPSLMGSIVNSIDFAVISSLGSLPPWFQPLHEGYRVYSSRRGKLLGAPQDTASSPLTSISAFPLLSFPTTVNVIWDVCSHPTAAESKNQQDEIMQGLLPPQDGQTQYCYTLPHHTIPLEVDLDEHHPWHHNSLFNRIVFPSVVGQFRANPGTPLSKAYSPVINDASQPTPTQISSQTNESVSHPTLLDEHAPSVLALSQLAGQLQTFDVYQQILSPLCIADLQGTLILTEEGEGSSTLHFLLLADQVLKDIPAFRRPRAVLDLFRDIPDEQASVFVSELLMWFQRSRTVSIRLTTDRSRLSPFCQRYQSILASFIDHFENILNIASTGSLSLNRNNNDNTINKGDKNTTDTSSIDEVSTARIVCPYLPHAGIDQHPSLQDDIHSGDAVHLRLFVNTTLPFVSLQQCTNALHTGFLRIQRFKGAYLQSSLLHVELTTSLGMHASVYSEVEHVDLDYDGSLDFSNTFVESTGVTYFSGLLIDFLLNHTHVNAHGHASEESGASTTPSPQDMEKRPIHTSPWCYCASSSHTHMDTHISTQTRASTSHVPPDQPHSHSDDTNPNITIQSHRSSPRDHVGDTNDNQSSIDDQISYSTTKENESTPNMCIIATHVSTSADFATACAGSVTLYQTQRNAGGASTGLTSGLKSRVPTQDEIIHLHSQVREVTAFIRNKMASTNTTAPPPRDKSGGGVVPHMNTDDDIPNPPKTSHGDDDAMEDNDHDDNNGSDYDNDNELLEDDSDLDFIDIYDHPIHDGHDHETHHGHGGDSPENSLPMDGSTSPPPPVPGQRDRGNTFQLKPPAPSPARPSSDDYLLLLYAIAGILLLIQCFIFLLQYYFSISASSHASPPVFYTPLGADDEGSDNEGIDAISNQL